MDTTAASPDRAPPRRPRFFHQFVRMVATYWPVEEKFKAGGLLASDDVFFHSAFDDFAGSVGARPLVWRTRLGILRKS